MARAMKALLSSAMARAVMIHFLNSPSPFSPTIFRRQPPYSLSLRRISSRSAALKPKDFADSPEYSDSGGDSENVRKSRNEKKREAQRAVRWGMELAKFDPPQIKRILRVAAMEQEAYEAIMLVKKLGRDVREGRRRQFSYIGRLLRDVEPELMDGLIEATKDGDYSKVMALSSSETWAENEEVDETEYEEEDDETEELQNFELADKWFDGLINKDIEVSNEIYSLREVEFDRQELRNLVRKVQSMQQPEVNEESSEIEGDKAFLNAKKSLNRFLRDIARQLPVE